MLQRVSYDRFRLASRQNDSSYDKKNN